MRWWRYRPFSRSALLVGGGALLLGLSAVSLAGEGDAATKVDEREVAGARLSGAAKRDKKKAVALDLPEGRAITALGLKPCHRLLRDNDVAFEVVDAADADGVEQPIRLMGAVGGLTFYHRNHGSRRRRKQVERLEILDCRVAIALLAWSPILRDAGVQKVDHYSIYRPGARVSTTGKPSGHATAMAIDVGELWLADGTRIDVETGWSDKHSEASPCPARVDDPPALSLLRNVVCAAADRDLFQVVITPHHNAEHSNHVHLELRPGVDWSLLE